MKMNIKPTTLCLCNLLALAAFVARPVLADEWNKKTEFQFSAPVQIPGHTLAAGKYVFQLAGDGNDQNVVQIFSEDTRGRESLVATLMAVPEYREETPNNPVVQFEERHSGSAEAIQSWFYPGENTGWEFVYPRHEASK
jgi:hypothetical protein